MPEETKVKVCPKCGSALVISIANQRHCNACGADFDAVKHPVARVEEFRGWPRPQKT